MLSPQSCHQSVGHLALVLDAPLHDMSSSEALDNDILLLHGIGFSLFLTLAHNVNVLDCVPSGIHGLTPGSKSGGLSQICDSASHSSRDPVRLHDSDCSGRLRDRRCLGLLVLLGSLVRGLDGAGTAYYTRRACFAVSGRVRGGNWVAAGKRRERAV